MKYIYPLIFIFLFFQLCSRGSESIIHYELSWQKPQNIEQDNQEITILSFSGSSIDPQTSLPVFYSRFFIGKKVSGLQAYLKNIIYESISSSDVENIPAIESISSEILIKSHISISRKSYFGNLSFIPIRYNQSSGQYEKLISFDLSIKPIESRETEIISKKKNKTYASASVLSSGNWYKVSVAKDGVYKLTYADLLSLGMNPSSINPDHIRIYGNGGGMLPHSNSKSRYDDLQENAIYVVDGGDSKFNDGDYILFFARGPHVWSYTSSDGRFHHSHNLYSDSTYYFITVDLGDGKRIESHGIVDNATDTAYVYDDYAYHENEEVNILKSGRLWYGEIFDAVTQYEINDFNFTGINTSDDTYVKIQVAAGATSSSSFSVDVAGMAFATISVSAITGEYYKDHAALASKTLTFTPSSDSIPISILYNKSTSSAIGWLDYIEINVRRHLIYLPGQQLIFRDVQSVNPGNITNFQIEDTASSIAYVWDITDIFNVQQMKLNSNGVEVNFNIQTDSLKEFIAFTENLALSPGLSGKIANQDLHAIGLDENGNVEKTDMIIITHPSFLNQAEELAAFHEEKDSLTVVVVTTDQVFNEFSSGVQDVCAIRDFLKMLYDRTDSAYILSQVLLFGDGSYDPKDRVEENTNFVVTYQNDSPFDPIKSYTSDDFFVLWDDDEGEWDYGDNGDLDAGIGRFPVKTLEEAQIAVDKIKNYYDVSTMGDWRNIVCFIADDEDDNLHLNQADALAEYVKKYYPQFNIDKIYLDAYEQISDVSGKHYPDVNAVLKDRVKKGALVINYTGHGGVTGLADERIIEIPEINQLEGYDNMPIFMTASCEVSRFDDPEMTTAGEHLFLNENGGGIALFSTVRVVYANYNNALNQDFYKTVFEKTNGKYASLGEIFMQTKNRSGVNDNSKNFTLLGDPALKLAIPQYNAGTQSINGNSITTSIDTAEALSKVTVSGYIEDGNGTKLVDYNGTLYPRVYDKTYLVQTLANDAKSQKTNFEIQNSVLFNGKASITNGEFTFSFMVPKDIVLSYGYGKLSYYFEDREVDGNGYYDSLVIGGSNPNAALDTEGPEVKLYLNDENFTFGDIINDDNPLMIALITDSNGVNTVGSGIGHDILATMDGNTQEALVLNDYYEAELNSYQSGKVEYNYEELNTGRHSLELKVWDVFDNVSLIYTEFVIAESADIAIKHVLNYPNPFTTHTEFFFEHNQAGIPMSVQIQIFTVSGKLIKTLNVSMQTDGIISDPIEWDGKDDFNNLIGRGAYIYRLTAHATSGKAEQIEKLVILR
jgi:hypothetical protein